MQRVALIHVILILLLEEEPNYVFSTPLPSCSRSQAPAVMTFEPLQLQNSGLQSQRFRQSLRALFADMTSYRTCGILRRDSVYLDRRGHAEVNVLAPVVVHVGAVKISERPPKNGYEPPLGRSAWKDLDFADHPLHFRCEP